MLQTFLKKRNSVLFSWIAAFVLVIILFIVIFMAIFLQMQASLKEEIEESNQHIAEHTGTILDTTVRNLKTSASQIAMDTKVRSLISKRGVLEDKDYYRVYEIVTMLQQIRSLNSSIETVAILDIPRESVYSTDGCTNLKAFYNSYYKSEDQPYEAWKQMFQADKSELFFKTRIKPEGNPETEKIHYACSLEPSGRKDLSYSVIFTVNKQTLLKSLEKLRQINNSEIYIVDDGQNVILASSEEVLDIPQKETNGIFRQRFSDGTKTVFCTQSKSVNWKYYMTFQDSKSLEKVGLMWYYCIIGLVVLLMVSYFLIRYFIKKNYMPIQNLLGLFAEKEMLTELDENEYRVIENFIRRTMQSNTVLGKKVDQQKRALRSRALERFLKGEQSREGVSWEVTLSQYDVQIDSPVFAVMLFSVVDEDEEETYDYYEMFFIISNVVEEMIGERDRGYMTESDGFIACLVNLKPEHIAEYSENLKVIAARANQFISQNFKFSFTVSVSSVVQEYELVPRAYQEALDVMRYKEVLGVRETLCYGEISEIESMDRLYNYSSETKHHLSARIKAGNYEETAQMIDYIFDRNLDKNIAAPETARYLLLSVLSTISETLNELFGDAERGWAEELLPMDSIMQCRTIPEIKQMLYQCLQDVCQRVNEKSQQTENWVRKDVLSYIAENYTDISLSVASIAENFNVHPVYLSRLFKEQVGEGLLDYITAFRIDHAKDILHGSKLSLTEVAERVGYNNARTFSRAFKKIEGITPGKYREIAEMQQSNAKRD